ncbi:hypothetical protein BHE74_00049627 [Ensete ventricosum]|nr:hypothetical protein BHE74_00049627 [Ensete ventricosum]
MRRGGGVIICRARMGPSRLFSRAPWFLGLVRGPPAGGWSRGSDGWWRGVAWRGARTGVLTRLSLCLGCVTVGWEAHSLAVRWALPHLAGRLEFIPHIKSNEYYCASEIPECSRVVTDGSRTTPNHVSVLAEAEPTLR